MRKLIVTLIAVFISLNIYSQSEEDIVIETLIGLEQYETITKNYLDNTSGQYSAQSLYSIGLSFYMLNNDANSLILMDLSLEKDSTLSGPYFIRGSIFNYANRVDEAIPYFKKALELEKREEKFAQIYTSLAWSYYTLNENDLALEAYSKSLEYDNTIALTYIMISQLYAKQDRMDKIRDVYREGREKSSDKSEYYTTILFNIGLDEQNLGNFDEAESTYKEILSISSNDYQTYAKLIQIYNEKKEYDKIPPLKKVLYDAQKDSLIKDENLTDMFCIDQFTHKGKKIMVFERYQNDDSENIYNKILFYILKDDGEIDYRIQTEYSPVLISSGSGRYMLCATKDFGRVNYGIRFKGEDTYEDIKNAVLEILDRDN